MISPLRLVFSRHILRSSPGLVLTAFFALKAVSAAPFAIQGPGVNPSDFRLTTFATGLGYPVGMTELPDGSLLVAVNQGKSFWSSTGSLLRLVDTNGDGIADTVGTVLFSGLPGGQTSLRRGGNLIFVTGQGVGRPITVLRSGETPSAPLTRLGAISINYPTGGWLHPHSALGLRETPGQPGSYDLLFQLGSQANFAATTATATLSSTEILGANGTLLGDSIYRLTITDHQTNVVASKLTRLARGLRNPAGFAFEPRTGDLYLEDNGIDGLVDANEPTSADELNRISSSELGSVVVDFGFPGNYTEYRTGRRVGGAGIQPLISFQPLPNPLTGSESEGPNDLTFAPRSFPPGLNQGIFIGFHGKFSLGGLANEENPLVYADPATGTYFHVIDNQEAAVGHLDGLLATADSLFIADLSPKGGLDTNGGTGVIYQLKSLVVPALGFQRHAQALELTWPQGVLQTADSPSGRWHDLVSAVSPHSVPFKENVGFFRVRN